MFRFKTFFVALVFSSSISTHVLAQKKDTVTPVFVANVVQQEFYDEIEALGTLQARENVSLTSAVVELVTEVNFTDGQRVKKGDVLLVMHSRGEQALKEEEQSRINEARRQVERLKPLVKRNASSKSALDQAQLELQTSQARFNELQTRIDERRVLAPFDGVLGLRNISVGALLQPGTLITTIDDDSVMKLDFSVPEVFLGDLNPGLRIDAITSAYPNTLFSGTIASLDSRIDPVTRALRVRALLENTDFKLRPGLLMQVKLQRRPRQTFVVPEEALLVKGEQRYVYTISASGDDQNVTTATRTVVETGGRRKGYVEITDGLNASDQVVIHGTLKIRDGSKVKVTAVEKDNENLSDLLKQVSTNES